MDEETFQKYIKAGKIAAQVREFGKSLIKPGAKVVDVLDQIENKIKELGGEIAFPAQISLNETAAHFCPLLNDQTEFKDQICKLDVGVHIDGYIADTATTVDLSGQHQDLIKASQEALNKALDLIKPGIKIKEIGKAIHEEITRYNFAPIKNLSGHGLGHFDIHTKPSIPNYDTGDERTIEEGMVFAVEPFASTGKGVVYESGEAGVFMLENKKPTRNPITRQVLKEIETYNGLPFAKRWLEKKFGAKVNFAFRELKQLGCLKEFPPLVDESKGLVSQAEHSVILKDKAIVFTRI
ncbi:MAG: type II methionyl aminopeptidase [Nanoarchaeota archaeon]|nr:type II methionyl aminopeptidase [Nanoarchaeota archaeon]